jgi:hypothetical protein
MSGTAAEMWEVLIMHDSRDGGGRVKQDARTEKSNYQ